MADLEKVEVLMHDQGISLRIVDESSQDGEDWFVQQVTSSSRILSCHEIYGNLASVFGLTNKTVRTI